MERSRRFAQLYKTLIQESHIILILISIIFVNIFILDIVFFWNKIPTKKNVTSTNLDIIPTATIKSTQTCNEECKAEIKNAVDKAFSNTTPIKLMSNTSAVREFFVTLGSGSSTTLDWTDVPGAQTYIDSTAYSNIKSVTFEASLYTPTGNQTANARLYNVTDAHPVWNSEVTVDGGTPQLKISNTISLDRGSKLYQVQMKTQLQSRTNLENARIHLITN